jgi:hypothetical protein
MAATDEDDEIFAYALPTDHYHISGSTRDQTYLTTWLREMRTDPAVQASSLSLTKRR